MLAAARGLLHGAPHVRAAALHSLPSVPALANAGASKDVDEEVVGFALVFFVPSVRPNLGFSN